VSLVGGAGGRVAAVLRESGVLSLRGSGLRRGGRGGVRGRGGASASGTGRDDEFSIGGVVIGRDRYRAVLKVEGFEAQLRHELPEDVCSVCLLDMLVGETLVRLKCRHFFHKV